MLRSMTVGDLITDASGRTWGEVSPYAYEFAVLVSGLIRKTGADSMDEIFEICAAVWSAMDTDGDLGDVIDGEMAGDVVSMRRYLGRVSRK